MSTMPIEEPQGEITADDSAAAFGGSMSTRLAPLGERRGGDLVMIGK
jgi:hypothetical protein